MDKDNMNKTAEADKNVNQGAPEGGNASRDIKKKSAKRKKGGLAGIMHMKQLRYGSLSIVLTVVVILLVMALNWVFGMVEESFAWSVDLSPNQKFSISDQTKEVVQGLDQDIKIYTLLQENSTTTLATMIDEMLTRYKALGHIQVENLDIVANPTAASRFQTDDNSLTVNSIVVTNADESKFRVISSADMYDREYGYDSNYQMTLTKNDFVGERAVTAAILYVTSEDTPVVYLLQGHGEVPYENMAHVTEALTAQNYEPRSLELSDSSVELNPGDVVMVVAPTKDLTDAEYEILKGFMEKGGRLYYSTQYGITAEALPNFAALLNLYGLSIDEGLVVEDVSASGRYYRQQLTLMPNIALTDENGNEIAITKGFNSSSYLVLPQSQAVRTPEMKQSGIVYTNVLTTSDKAYIKSNVTESTTIDRQANDETGTFAIAVAADKPNYDDESLTSRVFVVGNAYFLASESYFTAYDNGTLMLSPMEWLVNRDTTVYVPAKSLGSYTMSIPDNTTYQILTVTVIVAIPVIILLVGFIVWRRRRHL